MFSTHTALDEQLAKGMDRKGLVCPNGGTLSIIDRTESHDRYRL